MHKITKALFLSLISIGFILGLKKFATTSGPVFESVESKTSMGMPVFNVISWIPGLKQDVWMMNQSHGGAHLSLNNWDRLAIVIDKSGATKQARFYQLPPGPLAWDDSLINQALPLKVNCLTCHNNGPRAIRADYKSSDVSLSWAERIKIQAWNFRIKTYGRILSSQETTIQSGFKTFDETPLKVATCLRCHNEEGFLARGTLKRMQAGTMVSLLNRGEMPPTGFQLSYAEKTELQDYLNHFKP